MMITTKPTILAIDDSPTVISMYKLSVSDLAVELVTYNSAEAAIPYLESHQPDLILLDIMMPGMDGLTLLQALRENPLHSNTHIIMVTSKNYDQDKNIAKDFGALDFIAKPIRIQQIKKLIIKHTKALAKDPHS